MKYHEGAAERRHVEYTVSKLAIEGPEARVAAAWLVVLGSKQFLEEIEVFAGHRNLIFQITHLLLIETFDHSDDHFELDVTSDGLSSLAPLVRFHGHN